MYDLYSRSQEVSKTFKECSMYDYQCMVNYIELALLRNKTSSDLMFNYDVLYLSNRCFISLYFS